LALSGIVQTNHVLVVNEVEVATCVFDKAMQVRPLGGELQDANVLARIQCVAPLTLEP
jgi:hypothetical protein